MRKLASKRQAAIALIFDWWFHCVDYFCCRAKHP